VEPGSARGEAIGSRRDRDSLATRLLRDGATLDTIGAVLRHRPRMGLYVVYALAGAP
jgi:hypothetical protein